MGTLRTLATCSWPRLRACPTNESRTFRRRSRIHPTWFTLPVMTLDASLPTPGAAFVWKKRKLPSMPDASDGFDYPITNEVFHRLERNPHDAPKWTRDEIKRLAEQYQFFHWHLAFPDVFQVPPAGQKPVNELCGWNGGFDVNLGNPPWERVKLQEREWFAATRPEIAEAATGAIRERMIEQLKHDDPNQYSAYLNALRQAEGESTFARNSGRFPHSASGDTNTYPLFIESAANVIARGGRTGMIGKTGILADYSLREFFRYLVDSGRLVSASTSRTAI